MSLASLTNTAWALSCRQSLLALQRATRSVEATQHRLLVETLRQNAGTEFGQRFRFSEIRNADDFRHRVDLSDEQAVEPWIHRIAAGESNVLTSDRVRLLEPTSGSTRARKLIPYTDSLRRQFRAGIDAWIADLFLNIPELRHGKSYWSVTPSIPEERTHGGIKIGFSDDTEYLGILGRFAARQVLAVRQSDIQSLGEGNVLGETIAQLLSTPDLTLISVWSPTFLISLLEHLDENAQGLKQAVEARSKASRAAEIRRILGSRTSTAEKLSLLWPRLRLVSCWCDGASAMFAEQLKSLLPEKVLLQPKGLLSTEAFVSLPLTGCQGSLLSVRSHFFEFSRLDRPDAPTQLAHELTAGDQYGVIVTTAGGLYRYRTGDVITVERFHGRCPMIRFVGRDGRVVDLVGEKLTDAFVAQAIERATRRHQMRPRYACLQPQSQPKPGYQVLLDLDTNDGAPVEAFCRSLEHQLCQNPYYEHAIRVGQLSPLKASVSDRRGPSHWERYQERRLKEGCRRGDIKPIALDTHRND